MSEEQVSGIRDQVSEDQGARIEDQGKQESKAEVLKRITDDRLMMIAESIKAVGKMTNCGISYCIVIPGHGVVEDARLTSNIIAPPNDRSIESQFNEVCANLMCQLQGLMKALAGGGVEEDKIFSTINDIVEQATREFKEEKKNDDAG